MPNGKSRAKGLRGEHAVVEKLGGSARRTGHAFRNTPDVTTDRSVYGIKNWAAGSAVLLNELGNLQKLVPEGKHHYAICKPRGGKWVVTETLEQHLFDHGEKVEVSDAQDDIQGKGES